LYVALALQSSGIAGSVDEAENLAMLLGRADSASGAAKQLGGAFKDLYNEGRDIFRATIVKLRPFLCDGNAPKAGVTVSVDTLLSTAEILAKSAGLPLEVTLIALKICIVLGLEAICSTLGLS